MFEPDWYLAIFYVSLLIVVMSSAFYYSVSGRSLDRNSSLFISIVILLVPYSFLLGLRPVSSVFGDMLNYSRYFRTIGSGKVVLFGDSRV